MAGAPSELPRGPGDVVRTEVVQQPTPDFASGLNDIAQSVEGIVEKKINDDQTAKGADAVSRDPATGDLQFHPKFDLIPGAAAYNKAARASYEAQSDGDQKLTLQKIFNDNSDDPLKAQTLAQARIDGQVAKAPDPESKVFLRTNGSQLVSQFMLGAVQKKNTADAVDQYGSIAATADGAADDAMDLAYQHGSDTPEAKAAATKYFGYLDQLKNPAFSSVPGAKSPAELEVQKTEFQGNLLGEALRGHALNVAKSQGVEAGFDFIQSALYDPNYKMSMTQRDHFADSGRQDIRQWKSARADTLEEGQRQVGYKIADWVAEAGTTGRVNPDALIQINKSFEPAEAAQHIGEIRAAADTFSMKKQVSVASPERIGQMQTELDPTKGGTQKAPALTGDSVEGLIQSSFPGSTITSRDRTPEKNAAVGGVPDSAHMDGRARDFVPSGATIEEAAAHINGLGIPGLKAIAEGPGAAHSTGPHVHVEWTADASGGAGYAQRVKEYQAFHTAIVTRQKALAADPAGYVGQARPDIPQMQQTALKNNDLTGFQNGVRASLTVQSDMGVANPHILSHDQAKNIVQDFTNAPDPTKRGQHMSDVIDGLEQRYGSKYFPQVMSELVYTHLPVEAYALSLVHGDGGVETRMANAISAGPKALTAALPPQTKSDLDNSVSTALSDLRPSLVGKGDGAAAFDRIQSSAKLYAYQLVSEGVDPGKAADQAAHDVVMKRYAFVDNYRVPTGVDASLVQRGAEVAQQGVVPADVKLPSSVADPKLSEDAKRGLAGPVLRKKATWVTNGDDGGLTLTWGPESGYEPVRNIHGHVVTWTWDQLTAAANVAPGPVINQMPGF